MARPDSFDPTLRSSSPNVESPSHRPRGSWLGRVPHAFAACFTLLCACDVTLSATAATGQPCSGIGSCPSGLVCREPDKTCQEPADDVSLPEQDTGGASDGGLDVTLADMRTGPGLDGDADATVTADDGDASAQDASPQDGSIEDAEEDADATEAGDDAADGDAADVAPPQGCDGDAAPATLVLFGGANSVEALHDTWLWNGTSWSAIDAGDPDAGPPGRFQASMGRACPYAVMVGGNSAEATSDTSLGAWLWDGQRWRRAPSSPPDRGAAGAATFDGTLFLFGGSDRNGLMNEASSGLLAWDGAAWSAPPQAGQSPQPLREFFAFGATPRGLVAFGGTDDTNANFADTWLLGAQGWQLVDDGGTDASPIGLVAPAAATLGSSLVVFGGIDANGTAHADTWIWNGSAWSQVPAQDGGPPARWRASMATLSGQVVLFGGLDDQGVNYFGDTWLWDGGAWVPGPDAGPSPRLGAAMSAY